MGVVGITYLPVTAGGKIKMFTQAPAGFDNASAVNLWLGDGTPVFMTPRYLHYVRNAAVCCVSVANLRHSPVLWLPTNSHLRTYLRLYCA
jgi:hypothetical protein